MALATISNLSQGAVDAAFASIVGAADPVGYTPGQLASDLAGGIPTILAWVGAGVGGGIVLMLAFMGIRKGFAFFKKIGN